MTEPYSIVIAPNPSIMTGPGTNTLVLGEGQTGAIVIDPAVDEETYLDWIVEAGIARGGIKRILITHGHPDHIGGALALKERLNVPIYAFSREGTPFADELIKDGDTFELGNDTLRAIHTPGHRFDHLCFLMEQQRSLFAGDLVAGEGTVVIIPPEGDMQAYLNSLRLLQELDLKEIVPAHGVTISDPQARLTEYLAHRQEREEQILEALERLERGAKIEEIVALVYKDVDPDLHPMAAKSVEAHLLKLEAEGMVERLQPDGWALISPNA